MTTYRAHLKCPATGTYTPLGISTDDPEGMQINGNLSTRCECGSAHTTSSKNLAWLVDIGTLPGWRNRPHYTTEDET